MCLCLSISWEKPLEENYKGPIVVFDLDNTLYPRLETPSNHRRVQLEYMQREAGLDRRKAKRLYAKFAKKYHAVVYRGMVEELGFDGKQMETWCEDHLNLTSLLKPNTEDIKAIQSIPYPKFIFTNSGLY